MHDTALASPATGAAMNDFFLLLKTSKAALILFTASLVFSCLLVAGLHSYRAKKQRHILQVSRQLSIMRDDNNQLRLDLEMIDRFAEKYRQLQHLGFIGEADRSGWMQRLEDIYRGTRLPATLRYALMPAQLINAKPAPGNYRNGVLQHELTLELSGINDEEFLNFMARLAANWQVPYLVQGCQISRESEVKPGLQIKCTLQLYSLPQKTGGRT